VTPTGAQDKPRYGGELIFAVPSEMPSYDGHREGPSGWFTRSRRHYNTLLWVAPTIGRGRDRQRPRRVWTISPDGRVYILKLRRGVKFHDGSEMKTSRDVKASYDKIVFRRRAWDPSARASTPTWRRSRRPTRPRSCFA